MKLRYSLPLLGYLLTALFCCVWGSGKLQADEECPTWFIPSRPHVSNGSVSCVCGNSLGETVICNSNTNLSMLLYTNCMTYDELSNSTVSGFCAFSFHKPDAHQWYVKLPRNVSDLNDFVCGGLNRTGLQCGQCQPGLGPAVFSYTMQCLQCLDSGPGWVLYVPSQPQYFSSLSSFFKFALPQLP